MTVEIAEVGPGALPQFTEVPIRFRVESVLRVEETPGGTRGFLCRL